jgi:hypothetical protein
VAARHAITGRELPHDELRCDDCAAKLGEADLLTVAAEKTDESWAVSRVWCVSCAPTRPRAVDEGVLAEATVGIQSDPRKRRHYPVPIRVTLLNGRRRVEA